MSSGWISKEEAAQAADLLTELAESALARLKPWGQTLDCNPEDVPVRLIPWGQGNDIDSKDAGIYRVHQGDMCRLMGRLGGFGRSGGKVREVKHLWVDDEVVAWKWSPAPACRLRVVLLECWNDLNADIPGGIQEKWLRLQPTIESDRAPKTRRGFWERDCHGLSDSGLRIALKYHLAVRAVIVGVGGDIHCVFDKREQNKRET
ncbi:hypothetical protein DFH06DRAFT_1126073 [Mycena polygramma]|nr:hypothetical protein DFH06DRAFT_1126073 [Mycena polygramma]